MFVAPAQRLPCVTFDVWVYLHHIPIRLCLFQVSFQFCCFLFILSCFSFSHLSSYITCPCVFSPYVLRIHEQYHHMLCSVTPNFFARFFRLLSKLQQKRVAEKQWKKKEKRRSCRSQESSKKSTKRCREKIKIEKQYDSCFFRLYNGIHEQQKNSILDSIQIFAEDICSRYYHCYWLQQSFICL